jgi:hypothetical protein
MVASIFMFRLQTCFLIILPGCVSLAAAQNAAERGGAVFLEQCAVRMGLI